MKSTINRSATVVKLPNPSFHGPCENLSIEYIEIYYKIYFQNLSVAKNFESILCYIFSLTAELFSVANI